MSDPTTEFRLVLPTALHDQVREIAERERRKVGAQLVVLLEKAVAHENASAAARALVARQAEARA